MFNNVKHHLVCQMLMNIMSSVIEIELSNLCNINTYQEVINECSNKDIQFKDKTVYLKECLELLYAQNGDYKDLVYRGIKESINKYS